MIVLIDNYDSFTYNLVQYFGELGAELTVFRNDKVTPLEVEQLAPSHIVISPGPCTPNEAGISNDIIRYFTDKVPLLGVCLGHQCIGAVFGAAIVKASVLMHGKTSLIYHNGKEIFNNIENPFEATRYHSLIIDKKTLPNELEIIAWTKDDDIMGIKHKKYAIWGVQFHPESILTKEGKHILKNFMEIL
ncbi:anthranilate synthase component II [Chlamydiota bacterium]